MQVGGAGTGKTSLVKLLANICGRRLEIINPSPEMDTIELLGGFEQVGCLLFFYCYCLLKFSHKNCKVSSDVGIEIEVTYNSV